MSKRPHSTFVCARCGVSVGYWHFGWKHQNGWHGKPSCGQKPIPVERPVNTLDEPRTARVEFPRSPTQQE